MLLYGFWGVLSEECMVSLWVCDHYFWFYEVLSYFFCLFLVCGEAWGIGSRISLLKCCMGCFDIIKLWWVVLRVLLL